MNSPKVLMIGPAFSGGGAEGRFARVSSRVVSGNADVAVLLLNPSTQFQGHGRVIDLRWRGAMSYPRIIATLARNIRRARYDVVMGFGMFPNLLTVMAARLSGTGVRVVIHEITRPTKMLDQMSFLRRIVYRNLQRWVLSHADVMTANSTDGLTELREICPAFDGPEKRLENAIDIASLDSRLNSAPPSPVSLPPKYIVSVARLDHMKRVDTIIEAFERVANQTDMALVIVGEGEALESLKKMVMETSLSDKVVFTGRMSNPFGVVRGARALIMSSEYEGFSNTTLEAMIIGTPVISSYCNSDVSEMEQQGAVLGFVVGDSGRLAEHMITVIEDGAVAEALQNAAFSYVQKHAIIPSIQRYDDVLREASETKR